MFLPRYRAARERLALGLLCVVLHVGLESVEFVFGMSCVSVMQDRLQKGLPSVATLDSLFNSFTHCASTLCHRLSCCRFWARRSNSVPRDESPASCERCTTMRLASCKGFTFYQIAKVGKWLSLPMSLRTMPIDSWHLPP